MTIKIILSVMLTLVIGISYSNAKIDPDRIVGIWLLDEGAGNVTEDASENGYHGTITEGQWTDGKFRSALEIKQGGTVGIPLDKGTISDRLSFTAWLQFTNIGGQQNYFSIWDDSNFRYVPYKTNGHLLRTWTNTWDISSEVTVKAGTWYHVANVYDGKTASIYINGEEKVSQDVPWFQLQDEPQKAWLATDKGIGFLSSCIFDEVGLFKDALTKDEIQGIMNEGIWFTAFSVEPSGKLPVLWGKLKGIL